MALVNNRRLALALGLILGAALLLRLVWVVWITPTVKLGGGDADFYLQVAKIIVFEHRYPGNITNAVGPVYLIFLSFFYIILPEASVIQTARIVQAVLDTITCLITFDIGRSLFSNKVGLIAAAALAIDLRFIVQTGEIYTETLFIFLLLAGTWAFIHLRDRGINRVRWYLVSGVLFLLASLTRVVILPLPIILFGSLMLPRPTYTQRVVTTAIVAVGALIVVGYGAYIYQQTGTFVLVSEGLNSNFWMGSRGTGDWPGNAQFQADLDELTHRYDGRAAYLEDAFNTIAANPPAYLQLLGSKLLRTYLQPHGTVAFGGESLKDLLTQVLTGRAGFGDLISGDAFLPKLYIYICHFGALAGGLIGMWLTRKEWLKTLPLTLPIFYFTIVYTLLTIIPRYIFPIMPFFTLLAAYSGVMLWDAIRARRSSTTPVAA